MTAPQQVAGIRIGSEQTKVARDCRVGGGAERRHHLGLMGIAHAQPILRRTRNAAELREPASIEV